jgi:toxin ParE1/3/4
MIVRFTLQARADIQSIHDYIALENPVMAGRIVGAIELATGRLAQFPLLGRTGAVAATRELVIPRLPYIAVYRVNVDKVEVIAVFHAAQDRPRA